MDVAPVRWPFDGAAAAGGFATVLERAGGAGDGFLESASRVAECDCLTTLLGSPLLAESPSALRFKTVEDFTAEAGAADGFSPLISASKSPI